MKLDTDILAFNVEPLAYYLLKNLIPLLQFILKYLKPNGNAAQKQFHWRYIQRFTRYALESKNTTANHIYAVVIGLMLGKK